MATKLRKLDYTGGGGKREEEEEEEGDNNLSFISGLKRLQIPPNFTFDNGNVLSCSPTLVTVHVFQ